MPGEEAFHADVLRRLDQILLLLLRKASREPAPGPTEQIVQLHALGMKPREIAAVLNRKSNYVSSVLSQARKKGAKKARRKASEE